MVASNWACEYRTELYLDKAEMSGGRFAAIYPDPKLARDLEMSAFHIVFNPTGYQHTVRRAIEESSLIR